MNIPTPIQVEFLGTEPIITTSDEPIAKLFKHPDAAIRAAEIVTAVNYHDRLVECLGDLHNLLQGEYDGSSTELYERVVKLLTEIEKSK